MMWGRDGREGSGSGGERSEDSSNPGWLARPGRGAGGVHAPATRGGRRKRNRLIQQRYRSEVDVDDGEDVLASYYKSKLPADSLADDTARAASPEQQQQQQPLTPQQQQATVRADELIALAVQQLATEARTQHLLIRTPDIFWLHAGGNTETVIRQKCEHFGQLQRLKVFPRQAFACVSFADAKTAASAQIALDNHTVYCGPLAVGFLQEFLSRETILSCQHLPRTQTPAPDASLPLASLAAQGRRDTGSPRITAAGEGIATGEDLEEDVESYLRFLLGD